MNNDTPITITLTRIDLCNLALACTNARMHAGDTPNASKWTLLHDTIMAEIIAADEAAQEAPAAERIMHATQQAIREWAITHTGAEYDDMDARLEYINKRVYELTTAAERESAAEAEQQPTEEEEETPATPGDMLKVRIIIMSKGGYRERHLLTNPHTATRSTWTTEHKVVEILATTPDPDGYRPGCAVDIVTRSIVG